MTDTIQQSEPLAGASSEPGEAATLEEKVINCFADLFKKQLGLRRRAGAEITLLEASRFNPKIKTYTAKIKTGMNAWRSRRFTVGPIGENTGSKSDCFLVIYDDKIVVKVPPTRVTDFDLYVNSMRKEQQIVDKLRPRECIIPSLGVILKKYQPFMDDMAAAGGEITEQRCEEWLRGNPEFQEYFTIDGGFVYFMDLAKHVFLADALSILHGLDKGIQEEIIRDPTILTDFEKFEGRYGLENAQIGMDLKSVYTEFEDRLRKMMIQSGASPSLLLYKSQEWFLIHVAGQKISKDERDLNEEFVKQLNTLLSGIVDHNRDVINEYRQMVQAYLESSSFSQHRTYMQGIIANTLELLAWLRFKGIAIRDIKPDNLLVVGDPDRYPFFLSFPETYKIGLIDVETAVDVIPADGRIRQPQLGGTPFYATPLNMFPNKTLLAVYKDLPRALFLQDWFAALAMIYGIIINDFLFNRTAKQLVILTRNIQRALKAGQPPEAVIKEANKFFWAGAGEEFFENIRKNEERLRYIRILLPDDVRKMLIGELTAETKRIDKKIRRLISLQALFKSRQNQEQLYASSPERLAEIIEKVKAKPEADKQSLGQLQHIIRLKQSSLFYRQYIGMVEPQESLLSAYELLEIMFALVRDFMYPQL